METLRKLRGEAEAVFSRLSPRERVMVSAAGAAVAAFVLLMISMGVSRAVRAREARIDAKTQVLSQVGQLAQTYRRAQSERAMLEAKLQGPPVQLMSFISQTGARLGIEVNDLRPGQQAAGPDKAAEKVVEESVEVSLARLDIPKLAALLGELERGPGIVRVRRLALRGRSDDPAALDVTLVVATWQMKG
jgi:general secretion pathway protein M